MEARQAAHSADAVVVEAAESAKHERIEGEAIAAVQQLRSLQLVQLYGEYDGFICTYIIDQS